MLERAILIGLITPDQNKKQAEEYLEELAFLAKTAGAKPVKKILQKLNVHNNKTFLGKGKIEEAHQFAKMEEIELIIFDDDLSPVQLRNIERIFECKILDRNNLILDIRDLYLKT